MGKIIVSHNVTVDGVGQDPTGEEGFDRGGWVGRLGDDDRAAWAEVEHAEALACCSGGAATTGSRAGGPRAPANVAGAGERFLDGAPRDLRLVAARTVGDNLAFLTYRTV